VDVGATNEEAYRRALAADPVSHSGGIVAFKIEGLTLVVPSASVN
jgi:AICAR transformylase/IMP cyclohydrolase PurH